MSFTRRSSPLGHVHPELPINVKSFGAVGDGVTDDTAAFNLALKSADTFTTPVRDICLDLSGGNYAVLGTVYVRKGQTIDGGGAHIFMSDTGKFKLGFKSDDTQDAGGAPVVIKDLWMEGGLTPIDAQISGYVVSNVFFSASAAGPFFSGTDGVISDCIFDDGSTLCSLFGRNMVMTNCNFYIGNSSINLACKDSVISNCVFNYPADAAIRWEGPNDVQNVRIDNCSFMKNAQDAATFNGFIWIRNVTGSPVGNLHISNCNFRNCHGAAITNTGTGIHELYVENCTFDGRKTLDAYTQSTTMYAFDLASTGSSRGKTTVSNCTFSNLHDTPIKISTTENIEFSIYDCKFSANTSTVSMSVNGPSGATFTMGNIVGESTPSATKDLISLSGAILFQVRGWLDNWLEVQTDATYQFVEVPFGGPSLWDVTLFASPDAASDARYRAIKTATASISYDYDGADLVTRATLQDDFTSSSPTLLFDLDLQAAINTVATGTSSTGVVGPGVLVLYWPLAYEFALIDVQPKLVQRKPV